MGASQSTGGASTPAGHGGEVKTSYYELLDVERGATDDEIKKAYRRKALELHPDRNYGDVERTTALFAEVQSAYEVLSDPQERAWYDAHEMDILRGGDGGGGGEEHYEHNMRVTTADDICRMMGQFRGKVDFSDSPTGFYGFLRDTFDQLAKEEEYAADWNNVDIPKYSSFGHKDDTYEDVVRDFYSKWTSFATVKSFAWKDMYRVSDAPDRRVRRLMEKENKRLRDEGIRDFNDAVRQLVAFVRKRDVRYTPNKQSEEERAKAQREATKAQAARSRAANAAKTQEAVPEWATARDPEELEEETEEEFEVEHFECVACNKTFKSERQYETHEKSKKHQKAVQALRRKMQKDNAHLNLDGDLTSNGIITLAPEEDEVPRDVAGSEAGGSDALVDKVADGVKDIEIDDKNTGEKVKGPADEPRSKNQQEKRAPADTDSTESDSEDGEYASRSDIEARLAGFRKSTAPTGAEALDMQSLDTESTATSSAPKMGKAAQKRAKKAARQAEVDDSEPKFKCATCGEGFPTKNQLFQHLKDLPKHAAPVSMTKGSGSGKGKKGRK